MKGFIVLRLFFFLACVVSFAAAFFSIHYAASEGTPEIMNTGSVFMAAPSALQVADIYCRLSGLRPILSEDQVMLPTAEVSSQLASHPFIIAVEGGVLPSDLMTIIGSSAFSAESTVAPTLDEVLLTLKEHGVQARGTTVTARSDRSNEAAAVIREQQGPVVVLHYESPASFHYIRSLTESGNSTVTELTEFQISQYQICLWAGVSFVLIMLASVCSIAHMEVIPDSLLYAKFQSGRTGKSD